MRILTPLILLLLTSLPVRADALLSLDGKMVQGGYAYGSAPPGSQVQYDGIDVPVGPDGDFLIGFHRDEAAVTELTITPPGGVAEVHSLSIAARDYNIQRIDGLPPKSVTPPQEVLDRIARDSAQVKAARDRRTPERWFDSGWIWPVTGPISGIFGSQRILNGQPRQPHYGVDIAVPEGTVFVAPADGTVTLAHPDMYFSGGTLMIDHGRGLASAFLHLQSITVEVGQFVHQGDPLGTVGSTGRATGPHLDWRINWFDKRLDAELFVDPMPSVSQ